ncbi:cytochrome b [Methylovorus sp. MM2]|uniref:cytochrome b n=1 Tax=Methylovorus sp. MM2 TaxID=1848038 RepID=UPI0007DF6B83|nr:cytochrome b [Methylovorus sp. MM2]OAM52206.1 cytochrome b [Methylovorus sp. MM2]
MQVNSLQKYTMTAISLHWWIALLIFIAFPLGVYMHDLPLSPYKLKLFSWHKWIGVTVFLFAVLRIFWRISHQAPALPAGLPQWQKLASHVTHILLYVLIVAVPLSGWLMSSAKGFQTVWFGILPLPDLISKDRELGNLLVIVHKTLNFSLLALVGMHIMAALKHHFIDKDVILRRMLPFNLGEK